MKTLIIIPLAMLFSLSFAQQKCGTMDLLNQMISENPALKSKIDSLEAVTRAIIKQQHPVIEPSGTTPSKKQKQGGTYPCPRSSTLYETLAVPATVGDSISSICIYGGEYNLITNMVAGHVYEIHTCYGSNFDTQITIYNADDGLVDAYNDDYCGTRSAIYFTPLVSGNYEILINEYDCAVNTSCANLVVKLFYKPRPVITIPVVVHVVYNTSAQNITDAQIYSQINTLNTDFRRLNDGIYSAPVAFRGVSADPLFGFCLAQKDPNGNPTTGITRTFTNNTSFSIANNDVKYDLLGGKNNWDPAQYLNLWICNLSGGFVGYATFPAQLSGNPELDGIVVRHNAFGTTGTAASPYNLGRTTTHEVGHWLNLIHPWGDENCGNDFVFDTPPQKHAHYGCPSFPETHIFGCSGTTETGEMFVNFMDYTDDNCRNIFTYGQFARMDNTIFYTRQSLKTSQGCVPPFNPPTAIKEPPVVNYGIKIFPNPGIGIFTLVMDMPKGHNAQLTITNMLGQQVYTATITGITKQIDLSNYSRGIYQLQIITTEKLINKQIISE